MDLDDQLLQYFLARRRTKLKAMLAVTGAGSEFAEVVNLILGRTGNKLEPVSRAVIPKVVGRTSTVN